jgi:hypothetical protein
MLRGSKCHAPCLGLLHPCLPTFRTLEASLGIFVDENGPIRFCHELHSARITATSGPQSGTARAGGTHPKALARAGRNASGACPVRAMRCYLRSIFIRLREALPVVVALIERVCLVWCCGHAQGG